MSIDTKGRRGGLLAAAALWAVTFVGARLWIEALEFGSGWVYVAAALPVLPFLGLVAALVRSTRDADELERRIQLEGLAVGFAFAILVLMVLGLLEVGVDLDRDNFAYRHVWAFLPLFYLVGVLRARRRYGQ